MITKRYSVLIDVENATTIAYYNVFEEGDIWLKIKGCETCPEERRIKCCNQCPCVTPDGKCMWQLKREAHKTRKPFYCIIYPTLEMCVGDCNLEYVCVEGSKKGKIRRLKDGRKTFQETA